MDMGMLQRLMERLDEHADYAHEAIAHIRQRAKDEYGPDLKVRKPIEARRMKDIIRSTAEQGGEWQYKRVLAVW